MPTGLMETSGPGFGPVVAASALYVASGLAMQIGLLVYVGEFYKTPIHPGALNVRPILIATIFIAPVVWLSCQRARAPAVLLLVFSIFLFALSVILAAVGLLFLYSGLRCCQNHLATQTVFAVLTSTLGAILGGATVRACWRVVSLTSKAAAQGVGR